MKYIAALVLIGITATVNAQSKADQPITRVSANNDGVMATVAVQTDSFGAGLMSLVSKDFWFGHFKEGGIFSVLNPMAWYKQPKRTAGVLVTDTVLFLAGKEVIDALDKDEKKKAPRFATTASDGKKLSASSQAALDAKVALYEAGLAQGIQGSSNAGANLINTGTIDGNVYIGVVDGDAPLPIPVPE